MVGVAQLAERQVVVLDVVGSSPIVHPKCDVARHRNDPEPRVCPLHDPLAVRHRRTARCVKGSYPRFGLLHKTHITQFWRRKQP